MCIHGSTIIDPEVDPEWFILLMTYQCLFRKAICGDRKATRPRSAR